MKKVYCFTIILFLLRNICSSQSSILDSCFTSSAPQTSFNSSSDLSNYDADLMEWTGSMWIGAWPGANITIPPPIPEANCRAIFLGNGTTWTSGGEYVGVRLGQPLITGQSYSFGFTYVSHGFGSDGVFSPKVYTNASIQIGGAEFIDSLSPAGYTWTNTNLNFTATANQNGHNWLFVRTDTSSSSGIISSFCRTCSLFMGIEESNNFNSSAEIFPNPFNSKIEISVPDNIRSEINIYNFAYQNVLHHNFTGPTAVNTDFLTKGIYFFELLNANGVLKTGKLIKE